MTRQIGINDLKRGTAKTPVTAPNWNNNIDVIRAAHNETDTALVAVESAITLKASTSSISALSDAVGTLASSTTLDKSSIIAIANEINAKKPITPFCVNSGLTSTNKVDNSTISFTAQTGGAVVTFPDFDTYALTFNNVTGISSDGTYVLLIEKADIVAGANVTIKGITYKGGSVTPKAVLKSKVNETLLDGTGGADGDYNLNTSIQPNYPQKKVSGTWVVAPCQYLKLGEAVRTSGTMGTPVSYSFNLGKNLYVSPQVQPVVNTPTIINHNYNLSGESLARARNTAKVNLVCVIAEANYSIGDYAINPSGSYTGYVTPLTPTVTPNSIQINSGSGTGGVVVYNKSSGMPTNITPANWRYELSFQY